MRLTTKIALALTAASLVFPFAAARSASQDGLPPEVERLLRGQANDPQADLEEELRQLFVKVERALRRIDDRLFEAGAGEALGGDLDSGMGALLDRTLDDSRAVVGDIDRLLEIASQLSQQQQQQGGSSGGQGDQQGGESPLDGRRPPPRQGEERAPENPDQRLDPGANEPQPGEEDGGRDRPQGGQGTDVDQRQGMGPTNERGDPVQPGSGTDPWGDLPPRVQSIFRTQGGADMPPAYRGWIDAYHRRLGRTGR